MTKHLGSKVRQLVAGVLVAVAIGVVSVGSAPPAGACSCASVTDLEALDGADAAFTGSLVNIVGAAEEVSTAPERFVFDVQDVFKGEVTSRQTVLTPWSGASCGLEISGSGPFVVFAFNNSQGLTTGATEGELYSHLCSGTRALADGTLSETFVGSPPITIESTASASNHESGAGGTRAWQPFAVGVVLLMLVAGAVGWARSRPRL